MILSIDIIHIGCAAVCSHATCCGGSGGVRYRKKMWLEHMPTSSAAGGNMLVHTKFSRLLCSAARMPLELPGLQAFYQVALPLLRNSSAA